jgi:hypothetical protein
MLGLDLGRLLEALLDPDLAHPEDPEGDGDDRAERDDPPGDEKPDEEDDDAEREPDRPEARPRDVWMFTARFQVVLKRSKSHNQDPTD